MNESRLTKIFVCFTVLIFAAVSGCSSSSRSGGSAGGDAGFSDEDLAMGESRWGEGNIPQAQQDGFFQDIHFVYDSSTVAAEYHDQLRENAQQLNKDTTLHAEIEGHCDKRGTNEYNLALGEQRARSIASMLVSFGVKPSQLSTISYGEEIPLDPSDSEEAYRKNRRVHLHYTVAKISHSIAALP